MTSRFPVATDHHASVASNESSAMTRIAEEGPYARPILPPHRAVDAVLIDAIRASVGPFVPAPWRTVSAAPTPATGGVVSALQTAVGEPTVEAQAVDEGVAEGDALPWIESFLDASTEDVSAASDAPAHEAIEGAVDAAPDEAWPIEEAGEAIRAIADDLPRRADAPAPIDDTQGAASEAPVSPLRMWSEDDMMDIMPVKAPPPDVEGAEQWATRARRESEEGSAESAARALEGLAVRVRSGEIQLPTFSAEMGEAAALAAALAALLNLRR